MVHPRVVQESVVKFHFISDLLSLIVTNQYSFIDSNYFYLLMVLDHFDIHEFCAKCSLRIYCTDRRVKAHVTPYT